MLSKESNPIERIILCRPVVDCGQSIGFLPGTADEKVGPYLQPLFDELAYYFRAEDINGMMASKTIQIVPLSMMRGRTFNNSFVILDEAQNATKDELRMLLTRFGQQSKMVLAGDSSQSDMPGRDFDWVTSAVSRIPAVGVSRLGFEDIVREKLVGEIIIALDEADYAPKATNDFAEYGTNTEEETDDY